MADRLPSPTKKNPLNVQVHAQEQSDLDFTRSREDNPFADPAVAERYVIIYEKAQYECRHVFDPGLTWTPDEEKVLVRKLDWHVCLWAVRFRFTHLGYLILILSLIYVVRHVLWSSG